MAFEAFRQRIGNVAGAGVFNFKAAADGVFVDPRRVSVNAQTRRLQHVQADRRVGSEDSQL